MKLQDVLNKSIGNKRVDFEWEGFDVSAYWIDAGHLRIDLKTRGD